MKKLLLTLFVALFCFSAHISAQIPANTLISIVKAEDELRFDKTLEDLMKNADAAIRTRAALAAGRIGDEAAIPSLVNLLENDKSPETRTIAAFALGEIESAKASDAILNALKTAESADSLRARLTEAAGKIAAANAKDEKSKLLGEAILSVLETENARGAAQNKQAILLGLTAALRARPEKADATVAKFLTHADARIRADAGNTMSRIRAKNANEILRKMLTNDSDAIARANAARALGAAEDKGAFEALLNSALNDKDSRVRVSAIRSLGNLKDKQAVEKLLVRGEKLLADYKKSKFANPNEKSELLEIATVLSRILPKSNDEKAVKFLNDLRQADKFRSSETEIALAAIAPEIYLKSVKELYSNEAKTKNFTWLELSSVSQGTGSLANLLSDDLKKEGTLAANATLVGFTVFPQQDASMIKAVPDALRAYAAYKAEDLAKALNYHLTHEDIIVRVASAELLGDLDASKENVSALIAAFPKTKNDKLNNAALAILDALEKQYKKLPAGDETRITILKTFEAALDAPDYLIRRKTVSILKNLQLTESVPQSFQRVRFPAKTGAPGEFRTVRADYARAVSRKNGTVKAVFTTEKGNFTIDLTPEDAPLTVDNFIRLAKSNYFNGLAVHRVVPNFVMQDGDPRGDGNGGPGWQIRCEINMLEYTRGAVGMALSGKDTGGSQWFVTHSPQPHLDGGYTIFGKVNEPDMKIVDSIVRGDKILSVKIVEGALNTKPQKKK
jgi:cyclophilin family peptidyl-prolyl cis-trans isomerase/HEAT repeat protein